MKTLTLIILAFLGALWAPRFTLGCVLVNYGHPILGAIIIVVSLVLNLSNSK